MLYRLVLTEVTIMKEIKHPNILHLYDFFKSKSNYYMVMNYCNQGDLEAYMQAKNITCVPESQAINIMKQLLNGFIELRSRRILHRDIKLANIFMNDDHIIIGDFGLARSGTDIASTVLGTPISMSPEMMSPNMDAPVEYTSKADIWSLGIVFY